MAPRKLTKEERIDNFWSYVYIKDDDECWEWQAGTQGRYGLFHDNGKIGAHVFSFKIANPGIVLSGLHICHTCDNPLCVNPRHLFAGTAQDNANDKVKKGRSARLRGESSPHCKLSDEQISMIHELLSAGYKQQEIANRFNISRSYVSNLKCNWRRSYNGI